MDTNFRNVRRQNRVLDNENRIQELLEISEYGFVSFGMADNGYAYGLPLSYIYDRESNSLYFHCAPEGQKLDVIKRNDKVSFCVVGVTKPIANQFTTYYESVIAFGQITATLSDEEKRKCLRLLVKKYSAGFEELGDVYIEKSWARTSVFKIVIDHITAKAKYK